MSYESDNCVQSYEVVKSSWGLTKDHNRSPKRSESTVGEGCARTGRTDSEKVVLKRDVLTDELLC